MAQDLAADGAKALAVETERMVRANRDKLMQAELERYMQHAIGYTPPGRMYATTSPGREEQPEAKSPKTGRTDRPEPNHSVGGGSISRPVGSMD